MVLVTVWKHHFDWLGQLYLNALVTKFVLLIIKSFEKNIVCYIAKKKKKKENKNLNLLWFNINENACHFDIKTLRYLFHFSFSVFEALSRREGLCEIQH